MMDNKKVVNKVRKMLANQGYGLRKSRTAGYMVFDYSLNAVICGANFDFSIDDVIQFFDLSI